MTPRPLTQVLLQDAIGLTCAARGCTCEPTVTVMPLKHSTYLRIEHDDTCPALHPEVRP